MSPLLLFGLLCAAPVPQKSLTAQPPIVVPGGAGSFDFMNVDARDRLAFACHPGTTSLAVIHLDTDEVKSVPLSAACNGVAADSAGKMLYAAGPGKALLKIDMRTWAPAGSLPLDGPGDSVVFDSRRHAVYVDNDDGTNLWIVDPVSLKISNTVRIKEAPEVMVLDQRRGKIFQNIKTSNSLQVIDLNTNTVAAEYALGDLKSPHGLAEDRSTGRLFAVGKNGKLVTLDADSGKILSTVDVTKNSDQIAYDAGLKRLYIPGSGARQILEVQDDGPKVIDTVPAPAGCHSITVDSNTHNVWVAYTDKVHSYVMKFVVPK